jgi:hypothetical protein
MSFVPAGAAPASPLAPPAAATLEPPGPEAPELEGPELEVSDTPELELSEDPPPQPLSTSAAIASARKILALAVFADFTRRR